VVRLGLSEHCGAPWQRTNPIESAGITRRVTGSCDSMGDGDMRKRWCTPACSELSPSSAESKAVAPCQPFSGS